jgi:hypothetical protein
MMVGILTILQTFFGDVAPPLLGAALINDDVVNKAIITGI